MLSVIHWQIEMMGEGSLKFCVMFVFFRYETAYDHNNVF